MTKLGRVFQAEGITFINIRVHRDISRLYQSILQVLIYINFPSPILE